MVALNLNDARLTDANLSVLQLYAERFAFGHVNVQAAASSYCNMDE